MVQISGEPGIGLPQEQAKPATSDDKKEEKQTTAASPAPAPTVGMIDPVTGEEILVQDAVAPVEVAEAPTVEPVTPDISGATPQETEAAREAELKGAEEFSERVESGEFERLAAQPGAPQMPHFDQEYQASVADVKQKLDLIQQIKASEDSIKKAEQSYIDAAIDIPDEVKQQIDDVRKQIDDAKEFVYGEASPFVNLATGQIDLVTALKARVNPDALRAVGVTDEILDKYTAFVAIQERFNGDALKAIGDAEGRALLAQVYGEPYVNELQRYVQEQQLLTLEKIDVRLSDVFNSPEYNQALIDLEPYKRVNRKTGKIKYDVSKYLKDIAEQVTDTGIVSTRDGTVTIGGTAYYKPAVVSYKGIADDERFKLAVQNLNILGFDSDAINQAINYVTTTKGAKVSPLTPDIKLAKRASIPVVGVASTIAPFALAEPTPIGEMIVGGLLAAGFILNKIEQERIKNQIKTYMDRTGAIPDLAQISVQVGDTSFPLTNIIKSIPTRLDTKLPGLVAPNIRIPLTGLVAPNIRMPLSGLVAPRLDTTLPGYVPADVESGRTGYLPNIPAKPKQAMDNYLLSQTGVVQSIPSQVRNLTPVDIARLMRYSPSIQVNLPVWLQGSVGRGWKGRKGVYDPKWKAKPDNAIIPESAYISAENLQALDMLMYEAWQNGLVTEKQYLEYRAAREQYLKSKGQLDYSVNAYTNSVLMSTSYPITIAIATQLAEVLNKVAISKLNATRIRTLVNTAYQTAIKTATDLLTQTQQQTMIDTATMSQIQTLTNTAVKTILNTLTESLTQSLVNTMAQAITQTAIRTATQTATKTAVKTATKTATMEAVGETDIPAIKVAEMEAALTPTAGTARITLKLPEDSSPTDKKRLPDGSIAWAQGQLKGGNVWKYIPPPYRQAKPITLMQAPIGARNTDSIIPKDTIQIIGSASNVPKRVHVDLGWTDIEILNGKTIRFLSGGEKTNVGTNDPSPTTGMATLDAGDFADLDIVKSKNVVKSIRHPKKKKRLSNWEYMTTLKGFRP